MLLRRRLLCFLALVATLLAWCLPGASAASAISITDVNGRPPGSGGAMASAGQPISVAGTANVDLGLVADAGDSPYVQPGGLARLSASAAGGSGSYRYDWATSAGQLTAATGQSVDLDTTGLATGPVTATLTVTDLATGAKATDTVKAFVGGVATTPLLDVTQATSAGIPDEDLFGLNQPTSGVVDGETYRFPFTVPAGMSSLSLDLSWSDAGNDYDLYVEGPAARYRDNISGATGAEPEHMSFSHPDAGEYTAVVSTFLSTGDTFHLTAAATGPVPDPRPAVHTYGPFRFEVPETQALEAEIVGGAAPVSVVWDLDQDGTFESAGASVTADLPLGTHLVTAKATDAAGYEHRETAGVRVVPPGSTLGFTPYVVVGVNDTGINPYHREFSAATYPDRSIHEATNGFTRHPSEYLTGFPKDAEELRVTLGKGFLPREDCPDNTGTVTSAGSITATCAGGVWHASRIETGKLYWIPGTKIIGARASVDDEHPILDDNGHGTGAASVAVGNAVGSCPTCLLVFGEGFYDDWMKTQPWIDFVSNSYGNINLTPDLPVNIFGSIDVKDAVERGQTWLFASGNGHGNAFVAPNTTYTQPLHRPDWIVRVGAADAGSKKPILGDGNPADVSSYGDGLIPSASPISDSATETFGGTSCATPITSGVFGLVLGAARAALGDNGVGQRAASVIAHGTPVAGSPYLSDGELTRGELWELVFKTAFPGPQPVTEASAISPTYPVEQLHYLFEGYGIADQESAKRAIDVLVGNAPLPERPAEDDFFARDSALRVALEGSWTGYEEQYGSQGSEAAQAFAGVAPEQVSTLDAALAVLDPSRTLAAATHPEEAASNVTSTSRAAAAASSSAAAGSAVLAAPAPGSTHDVKSQPEVAVAGNAGVVPGTVTKRFFVRRDACGGALPNNERISTADGADGGNGCRNLLQMGANIGSQGYFFGEELYPASDGLPMVIDPARPVTGTLFFRGTGAAGFVVTTAQLLYHGAIIGEQRTNQPATPGTPVRMDLSFPVRDRFAGVPLEELTLRVSIDRLFGDIALSLDNPASFVDVPLAASAARSVELSLDDPSFSAGSLGSVAVDERDGSWGRNVDLSGAANGAHTVYARVRHADGTLGPVSSSTFNVVRGGPATMLVDLVPAAASAKTVTVQATFVDNDGRWLAVFEPAAAKLGRYDLVARLVHGDRELARSAPVGLTVHI